MASDLTGFLVGQPWWVDLIAVFIGASAWVIRALVKRSGDTGNGREALEQADTARDILADVALDERGKRRTAEHALQEVGDALGLDADATTDTIVAAAKGHRDCTDPTPTDPSGGFRAQQ